MSLYLIKALDGDDISHHLAKDLSGHCSEIRTQTVEEAVQNSYGDGDPRVVVVIVTPLMLHSLSALSDSDLQTLTDSSDQVVYLYQCPSQTDIQETRSRIDRVASGGAGSGHIELTEEEDFDSAEIKIRRMLRTARNEHTTRPSVRRVLLSPDTLTQGTSDVMVILLANDNPCRTIDVQIDTYLGKISPTSVRNGVWMIRLHDLEPGVHAVKVSAEGADLGSATLKVESRVDSLFGLLPTVVRDNPVEFFCKLFNLDQDQLDDEFLDLVNDGTEDCIFMNKCIDRLLKIGEEFPTSLHFCVRHELGKTVRLILARRYGQTCQADTDNLDRTPRQLALELNRPEITRLFKTNDDDEVKPLQSPIRKNSSASRLDKQEFRFDSSHFASAPGALTRDEAPWEDAISQHTPSRTLSRSGLATRRNKTRDSGNSSSGSAGSQSSGRSTPRHEQRGRLASDGELHRETILFENLQTSMKSSIRGPFRMEHPYETIDAEPDKQENIIRKREHHYEEPWGDDDHIAFHAYHTSPDNHRTTSEGNPKLVNVKTDSTDL